MLHGHTKIELKNEKTGEVQVVEKDNMVTDAIQRLFSDIYSSPSPYLGLSNLNNILPICPNAIGSILLFEDVLELSNDDIIIPIVSNNCIGYASNDVNTSTDTKRGSMNLTESGPLENGYKFVWDFATNQANGQISSIGLSNKTVGAGYVDNTNIALYIGNTLNSSDSISIQGLSDITDIYKVLNRICTFNIGESKAISISKDSSNILIRELNILGNTVHLNDRLTGLNLKVLSTITPSSFLNVKYYMFFDNNDNYYYGFGLNNYTMYSIKINKSDYTYTENSHIFDNTLDDGAFAESSNRSVVINGYLYIISSDKSKLYKIDINDISIFNTIELGFTSNYTASVSGYDYVHNYMFKYNEYIICSDFIFDTKTQNFYKKSNNINNIKMTRCLYQNDLYMLYLYTSGTSDYRIVANKLEFALFPFYLATKNNLDRPVTKTSEQSMKITYTITEVEDK